MMAAMNENYQSSLNRLIQELCPDGVEYGKLGDFATVLYGYPCDASKFNTDYEGVPVIRIRDVMPGITETYTTETIPEQYIIHKDDFLVGMDGNFNCGKWKSEDGFLCQRVCRIKSSDNNILLNEFLFHFLGPAFKKIEDKKLGGTVKHLSAKDVNDIQIPLPPMEVQRKIARILDSFAELTVELTTELTAELTARKTQYEYYRDRMLKFGQDVPMKKLGDVCQLVAGATPSKAKPAYWENGTIPWMSSGEINLKRVFCTEEHITKLGYDNASTTMVPPHSVVIALAGQGKTRGKVAITEIELCTNQSLCSMICGNEINYKFLYYYLDSKYDELRAISNGDGSRGGLSLRILAPYKIPVPSIEEQNRIVSILDRFDVLCNDISSGIPAEIEARQQQYEYYRDKLLQFEKKS